MADDLREESDTVAVAEMVEASPRLLLNGKEFATFSDHDVAGSSHSEDEGDRKYTHSPIDSHSDNDTKDGSEPFQPPSQELSEKIVSQVEFYLSDENLAKDAFLLKHVRRNKEGYVNLKLITSFKKVKTLTKDFRVVAEALEMSTKLSMNSERTKVKRNTSLPSELLERNPGRTVVVTGLENPSMESVSEIFSKCGEIELIRIVRPGKATPSDLKMYFTKHPELETETCAVVAFETMAAAARACSEISKEGGMKVVELGKQGARKEKSKTKSKSKDKGRDAGRDSDEEHDDSGNKRRNRKKDKRLQELIGKNSDDGFSSSCSSDTDNSYSSFSSCRRRYNNGGNQTPDRSGSPIRGSPSPRPMSVGGRRSPQSSPELSRKFGNLNAKEGSSSAPNSPWSQRRKFGSPNSSHSSQTSPLVDSTSPRHRMIQLEGVERLPKGPDGTKGFNGLGRGRPLVTVA
ncbi:la-related protein 6-like [Montipora capricornis]|uniref:la-related protein 6-like n=1 Tax=Montipora foliosa TaxID=591990 RepID=UPI0035F1AB3C